jgi:hypothetical protein
MVNEVDNSICDWHADDGGKSFVIKQQKAFETSVIPQFFKHSKIASFVRVSERSYWIKWKPVRFRLPLLSHISYLSRTTATQLLFLP